MLAIGLPNPKNVENEARCLLRFSDYWDQALTILARRGDKTGPITCPSSFTRATTPPAVSLKYAGELIAAFIERAGGSVKGEITTGSVPEGLKPVYVHRQSRTLSQQRGFRLRLISASSASYFLTKF